MATTPKTITIHHADKTVEVRELSTEEQAQFDNVTPSAIDAIFAALENTPPA